VALLTLALTSCSDKAPTTEAPSTLDLPAQETAAAIPASASGPAGNTSGHGAAGTTSGPALPKPLFRTCTTLPAAAPAKGSFRHRRSKLIAKLGRVAHSAQDIIAHPGEAITIPGKFAYGRVSKDLEDETVAVVVDTCAQWTSAGQATSNDDGRTALTIPAEHNPGVGVYQVRQVVQGDGSSVGSRLTVVPRATHLVVLDVDGTLTIGDNELADEMKAVYLDELVSGKRSPEPYPDSAALTKAWRDKGYQLVYMTGRPYWLAELTRAWLRAQGCAPGHLHTTDRTRDARPTQGGVGEFKAAYLKELIDAGYLIDYVYGNAESDVFAYAKAGISPAKTHIIGEFAGKGGTQPIQGGYTEHIHWVSEQPDAVQPFAGKVP
jgi:hypothetical protein